MDKKQNKTYTFSHPFFERNLFFLFLVASVRQKKTAHRHLRYLRYFLHVEGGVGLNGRVSVERQAAFPLACKTFSTGPRPNEGESGCAANLCSPLRRSPTSPISRVRHFNNAKRQSIQSIRSLVVLHTSVQSRLWLQQSRFRHSCSKLRIQLR